MSNTDLPLNAKYMHSEWLCVRPSNLKQNENLASRSESPFLHRNQQSRDKWRIRDPPSQSTHAGLDRRQGAMRKNRSQSVCSDENLASRSESPFPHRNQQSRDNWRIRDPPSQSTHAGLNRVQGGGNSQNARFSRNGSRFQSNSRSASLSSNRGRKLVHSYDLMPGLSSTNTNHDTRKSKADRLPQRMEWLKEYSDKNASDIVAKLANSHSGFEAILKSSQLLKEMPHVLILVVKMLAKVGDADFMENKILILTKACAVEFLDELTNFTNFLPTERKISESCDVNEFLHNVLLFSKSIAILLPSTATERFNRVLFAVNACIIGMQDYCQITISDDVKNMHQEIRTLLVSMSESKDKKVTPSSAAELVSYEKPPNDFRDINLIPTVHDIFAEEIAFVRPNLVRGAYVNTEHYLDVQFRLLHEDFLRPMREGILEYIEKSGRQNMRRVRKVTNVRLYNKIIFLGPKVVSDRIGIIINFDPDRRLKKMNWRNSKRFMYGSLLCFTQDNFKSIMFGTVVERDDKEMQRGLVVVELCIGSQIRDDLFRTQYTMAESEVYFEPYYQVLKALKELKEEEFPMKRYIVDANCEGQPPAYLVSDVAAEYTIDSTFKFPVLVDESWPSADELGLDESQYRAFKFALTKEFVVIQGPPGTGKTFLGLKVARVLLENHKVWNADRKPILVVCYTNHALDQFLEDLLKHTKLIVRAGSQSKSEIMEQFSLRKLRRDYKRGSMWGRTVFEDEDDYEYRLEARSRFISRDNLGRDIREKMEYLMSEIKRIQLDLEKIERKEGIISLQDLQEQDAIPQDCYWQFPGDPNMKEQCFVNWLLSQSEYAQYMQNTDKEMKQNEEEEIDADEDVTEDLRERVSRDIHEDYDLEIKDVKSKLTYAASIDSFRQQQSKLRWIMKKLSEENDEIAYYSQMPYLEYELNEAIYKAERLEQRLRETRFINKTDKQRLTSQTELNKLSFDDRWMFYRYWISVLKEKLLARFKEMEEIFSSLARQYEEVRNMIDLEIMKNSHIIGMTTTYAARYQTLLKTLKPKIVIVEEAAEVLESHIIVSLTSHCQHLILIGDHQQLRPSTSVYKLAKEFCLDVSLFERMLNNGMHCEVLKVQHRMRPEIASLICPSIYPVLINHEDVTVFDQIQGVTKNLFFIDHSFPEEEVGDNFSRRNVHEAEFLVMLCRHLVQQGYEPSSITILATYTAQMFYMKSESKKYDLLRDVRITVVDNFQGEENDIILLSLVRSNEEDSIGFLKIENRVCVALSRAKKGMYIMGNMKNLLESNIWPKIKSTLDQLKSIGQSLELQCKVHPDQRRLVSKAEDFTDISEGGCKLQCEALLSCGHNCQSMCHASDREHSNYRCPVRPCDRVMCVLDHRCKKTCFEECGPCLVPVMRVLACGHEVELQCYIDYNKIHCQFPVKKELPLCKHIMEMACSQNPASFPCRVPCDSRLENCGHSCRRTCHVTKDPDHLEYKCMQECARTNAKCSQNHRCTKVCHEECGLCEEKVKKGLPNCGHTAMMACSQDPDTYKCEQNCERTMDCGHKCKKKCFEECTGCNVKVKKSIPGCGHKINLRCSTPAEQSMCQKPCERNLPCGHRCSAICGEQCVNMCKQLVTSKEKAECGHTVQIPCFNKTQGVATNPEELLSYCTTECGTELECGHMCPGTCSKCFQGRLHISCQKQCGRTLICGHPCHTPCAVTCPPCREKCVMRCYHNKCKKMCGEPCTPCRENCGWKCKHYRCTRKCFETCNRPPCFEPCSKINKCGHPCIGFCGEPCPKLCRVCDKDEVTTVVFGNEDEPDARFVLLQDCDHVIEHRDLEHWLTTVNEGAVTMAVCPKCKTPISRNLRFSNLIKKRYAAVCEVKQIVFGKKQQINQSRKEHVAKLQQMMQEYHSMSQPVTTPVRLSSISRLRLIQQQTAATRSTRRCILSVSAHFENTMAMLIESLSIKNRNQKKNTISNMDMETLGIKTKVLCQMGQQVLKVTPHIKAEAGAKIIKHMDPILQFIRHRNKILSRQEVADLNLEAQRFHRIVNMCVLESQPYFLSLKPEDKILFEEQLRKPLMSVAKYSMALDASLKQVEKSLSEKLGSMQIVTQEEREQVVKAVGMKPGHWYKCPNGHYYIIGECGGANQIGTCIECKSQVGGQRHQLVSGNQHAPEMDGSKFAAWSEAANLANYAFGWNRWW